MATVRHTKVSGLPNPADPSLVGGEDWDSLHDVTLVDGDIPASIARDSEVTSAVGAEATARANAITSAISGLSTVYQPLDSDLTAIAALSTTSYGRAFLALADAAAARTALALGTAAVAATGDFDAAGAASTAQGAAIAAAASDATTKANAAQAAAIAASQPVDSDLTAIAALTTTSFGRGLLVLADAAALRSSAGLGSAALSAATDFQPIDSDLTAIAALTTTSFGRSVLALADAAALRTLAGSVIGTDVEAHDADLTTIAGLSPSNDDVLQRKAGAWANRTIAQLLTDLGIAATYQPLDSDLTAIAALTTTSFGRAVLALADAAALRTAAGLGTLATQSGTFSGTSSGTNTGDQSLPTRASLGLDTTDNPQFAGVNVGAATDTTITRTGAGDIAVEGHGIYRDAGTDVPVADGGTGASTASGARTNLGLVIGTDVQAQDAELAAIAGLTSAADKVPYFTGSGTAALNALTSFARGLLAKTAFGTSAGDIAEGNHTHAGGGMTDAVQTNSGAGNIYVPGLRGSPDAKPASPAAKDDEFEALSGWTTHGSLDISNVSDFPSNLHIGNTSIGYAVNGIYKAVPSIPFTVTAKLSGFYCLSNYLQAGIMLLDATPTALYVVGPLFGGFASIPTDFAVGKWTNRTTRASATDTDMHVVMWNGYIRIVVNSSSNVDLYFSDNGYAYIPILTAQNPGFTVANVGLAVAGNTAGGKVDAFFDWIRFS